MQSPQAEHSYRRPCCRWHRRARCSVSPCAGLTGPCSDAALALFREAPPCRTFRTRFVSRRTCAIAGASGFSSAREARCPCRCTPPPPPEIIHLLQVPFPLGWSSGRRPVAPRKNAKVLTRRLGAEKTRGTALPRRNEVFGSQLPFFDSQ